MAEKRKRQKNFVTEEKLLLLNIVQKYKNILLNKKTDQTTWKEKEDCWQIVAQEFNASSPTSMYI